MKRFKGLTVGLIFIVILSSVNIYANDNDLQYEKELTKIADLLGAGEYEKVIELSETYIKTQSVKVDEALYYKGLAKFRLEKYEDALNAFDVIIKEFPNSTFNFKALFKKAECYRKLKKYELAVSILENETKLRISDENQNKLVEEYINLATDYINKEKASDEDIRKGVLILEKRDIENIPKHLKIKVCRILADAKFKLKQYNSAYSYYVKCEKISDEKDYALFKQGESLFLRGQRKEANKRFIKFRNLYGKDNKYYKDVLYYMLKIKFYSNPNAATLLSISDMADTFFKDYPNYNKIEELFYLKATAYYNYTMYDYAIKTCQNYLSKFKNSDEHYEQILLYLGDSFYSVNDYQSAIDVWEKFIKDNPSSEYWNQVHNKIIVTKLNKAEKAYELKEYNKAIELFNKFVNEYPAVSQTPNAMLKVALSMKELKQYDASINLLKSISEKYKNTNIGNRAEYLTGFYLDKYLNNSEESLKVLKNIKRGRYLNLARGLIKEIENPQINVLVNKIYSLNETTQLELNSRNMQKIKFNIYKIDMVSYFYKMHKFIDVNDLDIGIIEPDNSFELEIPNYKRFVENNQIVDLPIEKAGVYVVTAVSDILEAKAIIIKSNFDIITKFSEDNILVFAVNRATNQVIENANVILSSDTTVISQGKTNKDGVYIYKEKDVNYSALNVLVYKDDEYAVNSNISNTYCSNYSIAPVSYIYTDKGKYQPGETVNIKGIFREVIDNKRVVPTKKELTLSLFSPEGNVIQVSKLKVSEFGSIWDSYRVPNNAPIGIYKIFVSGLTQNYELSFMVDYQIMTDIIIEQEGFQDYYYFTDKISGKIRLIYYNGMPVKQKNINYSFMGKDYTAQTDMDGYCQFNPDTSKINYESNYELKINVPTENLYYTIPIVFVQSTISMSINDIDNRMNLPQKEISFNVKLNRISQNIEYPEISTEVMMVIPNNPFAPIETANAVFNLTKKPDENGEANFTFYPEISGKYQILTHITDNLGHLVYAQQIIDVVDIKNENDLFITCPDDELNLNKEYLITIKSKTITSPVLLTYENKSILQYKVIKMADNKLALSFIPDMQLYPNFYLTANAVFNHKMNYAEKHFTLNKNLNITAQINKKNYKPGDDITLNINVTDQNGTGVKTELSVLLIREDIYNNITDGLYQNIARDFTMKTIPHIVNTYNNASFNYSSKGDTIDKALIAYDKEMSKPKKREKISEGLMPSPINNATSMTFAPAESEAEIGDFTEDCIKYGGGVVRRGLKGIGGGIVNTPSLPYAVMADDVLFKKSPIIVPYWNPEIKTDDNGNSSINIKAPQNVAPWIIKCVGVSENKGNEATLNFNVKKEIYTSIKTPNYLIEGDTPVMTVNVIASDPEIKSADLNINYNCGIKKGEYNVKIDLANGTGSFDFGTEIEPNNLLIIEVNAISNNGFSDTNSVEIPVRPKGLYFSSSKYKSTKSNEMFTLKLDKNNEPYSYYSMNILLSSMKEEIIYNLFLNNKINGAGCYNSQIRNASKLFGLTHLYKYLLETGKKDTVFAEDIKLQITMLYNSFVSTQTNNGYWEWARNKYYVDEIITANIAIALANAEQLDFINKNKQMDKKLLKYLQKALSSSPNYRAMLLYAISNYKEVSFKHINTLYRDRNTLRNDELAYLALALDNNKRYDMKDNVIKLLISRVEKYESYNCWGSKNKSGFVPSFQYTSLVVYAILKTDGKAFNHSFINWINNNLQYLYYDNSLSLGFYTAIITMTGIENINIDTMDIKIEINEKEFQTVSLDSKVSKVSLNIPSKFLKEGDNKIKLTKNGKGVYYCYANLVGFSKNISNPNDKYSRIYKSIKPDYLVYKNKKISRGATVISDSHWKYTNKNIKNIKVGQKIICTVSMALSSRFGKYYVIDEYIPAGFTLNPNDITGSYSSYEILSGVIRFYSTSRYLNYEYALNAYSPGKYTFMTTYARDLDNVNQYIALDEIKINIFNKDKDITSNYELSPNELYNLGKLNYDDNNYKIADKYLTQLVNLGYKLASNTNKSVSRMLLKIALDKADYENVVKYAEIITERYNDIYISLEDMLNVGVAYSKIGENERACMIFDAVLNSAFKQELKLSNGLYYAGRFYESLNYIENVIKKYPDSNTIQNSMFSIAQQYGKLAEDYEKYYENKKYNELKKSKITYYDIYQKACNILKTFINYYSDNPLCPQALFSAATYSINAENYKNAEYLCDKYIQIPKNNEILTDIKYINALSSFMEKKYDRSIKLCNEVITLNKQINKNDLANTYITYYLLGQIYHSMGDKDRAIEYYTKIRDKYPDANKCIEYFTKRELQIPSILNLLPGEKPVINCTYKNIDKITMKIYKIDLMRLFLLKKSLDKMAEVNLAGITPEIENTFELENSKYEYNQYDIKLNQSKPGVYFVMLQNGEIFRNCLIVISPLKTEVTEDVQRHYIRINVTNVEKSKCVESAEVRIIGRYDDEFISGMTDLRGVYETSAFFGAPTALIKDNEGNYALFASEKDYSGPNSKNSDRNKQEGDLEYFDEKKEKNEKMQYTESLQMRNYLIQEKSNSTINQILNDESNEVQFDAIEKQK